MPVRFRDLVERRVPQVVAIYLGAGWGLIEFVSFMEERFAISPAWTNVALFAWMLLIPSVLIYTWNHGRPGRDTWVRSDKIGIPLNVAVTLAILTTAFGGDDLGATMRKVTVTDESGEQIERVVPKSTFRKRVALFWFNAAPSDTAALWAREGAAIALSMDLIQDVFLDVRTPQYFHERLREAGVADGHNVPVSLMQKIAQEQHLPYFVTGSVATGAGGYTVRTTLYETATTRVVKQREVTNADLLAGIDELSVQLRADLELPASLRGAAVTDREAAELLSSNAAAVRELSAGYAALMRTDYPAADAALTRATTLDPTFAIAHYVLYQVRSLGGDPGSAMTHLTKAMQHGYRMPERLQMLVKVETFLMQQEADKALAVATMMVELYPDDILGHQMSAQLYSYRKELGKAIASLRRILELDPQQQEVLLSIAALQEQQGEAEGALKTYLDYAATNRSDAATLLKAGRIQLRLGRTAEARATFERAIVVDPSSTEARVDLALLERNIGNSDSAFAQVRHALAAAATPEDSMRALTGLQSMYHGSGRLREAIDAFAQRRTVAARFAPPIQVLALQLGALDLYVEAGQRPQAEAMLARIRTQLTPPLDDMWQQGALIIAIETRDTARIHESSAAVQRIIDGFGFRFMEPLVFNGDAVVREVRGDWAGAAEAYEKLKAAEPSALGVNRDIARCYRNLGRLDDALRVLDEHLRAAPYSPESNLEAARIRLAQHDAAGARTHLERAALMLAHADAGYAPAQEVTKLLAEAGAR
ncbi:MAG TPA: tetratricopeptide repeat protein [Longimicrobiales bacterium]|nr:tetratricopeptide repeat protein [Longimicrobiales bacterium]